MRSWRCARCTPLTAWTGWPDRVLSPTETLDHLWTRGSEFLGAPYAILGGAMTWVSERNLVAAISNAGGFGVIACGAMEPDRLREEIQATRALTDKPFGVNLITMHPHLSALTAVCLEERVSHIVLAGGIPTRAAMRQVKDGGAKLICFAPALILARKLVRDGVDALVIEGTEAGGHVGPASRCSRCAHCKTGQPPDSWNTSTKPSPRSAPARWTPRRRNWRLSISGLGLFAAL